VSCDTAVVDRNRAQNKASGPEAAPIFGRIAPLNESRTHWVWIRLLEMAMSQSPSAVMMTAPKTAPFADVCGE